MIQVDFSNVDLSGKLIVIEGGDGTGKTTLVHSLTRVLVDHGVDVVSMREPGGCGVAEDIRSIVKGDYETRPCDMSELLLFLAARKQIIEEKIKPLLAEGKTVILDRFIGSTYAYQICGREVIPKDQFFKLTELTQTDMMPDLTVLLHMPVLQAKKRLSGRQDELDHFDALGVAFAQKVSNGYLEFMENIKNKPNVYGAVLDADTTREDLLLEAVTVVHHTFTN